MPNKPNFPLEIVKKERIFLSILLIGMLASALVFQNPAIAMWLGFVFAAYSAIGNDSIQTIGTFIGSNSHVKWYWLWLFMGGIFLVTITTGYVINDGDVAFGRLSGLTKSGDGLSYPEVSNFAYLQLIAPLILLILTRLKMPVSTSILLLASFAAEPSGIEKVLLKSIGGYGIAFVASSIIGVITYPLIRKKFTGRTVSPLWALFQWVISGTLWAVWIMQDAANIAVYLPRTLGVGEFVAFSAVIFFGLAILFYLRGDKIQQVVSEKTRVEDIRAATLIDLIYSLILIYKLTSSTVPMSTTWVFLGVIGGRELALNYMRESSDRKGQHVKKAWKVVLNDIKKAAIGLIISLILAVAINEDFRAGLLELIQ